MATNETKGQAALEPRHASAAGGLKAQAAMEYLVTYGWALLVLVIAVAYLLSSGAFSANSFASQECVFQPDLPCSPYVLYSGDGETVLKFSLTNGLGFPINISSINYTTTGIGAIGRRVYSVGAPAGTLASGAKMNVTQIFPDSPRPSVNDFKTIYVELSYFNCRNSPCSGPYFTSGRVSAVVQKN
ncbi:MAG: hypothetical protein WCY41_04515 [Candidatus Micrarchaeia archaeon]